MSQISRIKTWVYEKLTYADLNAEFDNVVDGINALDTAFPTITSFAETLLDDTSASSARTTLEFDSGGNAYGTTAGTACEGNDSRLSDARTPTDSSVTPAKLSVTQATATSTATTYNQVTLTGGGYVFYPQLSVTSGNSVYWGKYNTGDTNNQNGCAAYSTSTTAETLLNLAVSGGTGTVTWNYLHSSPPYDLGDGDVNGFVYLKIDKITGDILLTHIAEDPPWYGNSPKSKNKLDGMDKTPHPFANSKDSDYIIMADPMSDIVKTIIDMQRDGEPAGHLFHDGELIIGEKVDRHTPPGVDAYEIKWK
jgi:hypothetical protein